ncbi:hypothetical protein Tco_1254375 [Tanacetum coccineum]
MYHLIIKRVFSFLIPRRANMIGYQAKLRKSDKDEDDKFYRRSKVKGRKLHWKLGNTKKQRKFELKENRQVKRLQFCIVLSIYRSRANSILKEPQKKIYMLND